MGKSYSDLLKDPRWQQKRLEVMQRAEFTCELCCEGNLHLHVHHGYYEKGKMPWEYPDDSYHCLCEDCHVDAEQARVEIRELAGRLCIESQLQLLAMLRHLSMAGGNDALLTISRFKREAKDVSEGMVYEARSS